MPLYLSLSTRTKRERSTKQIQESQRPDHNPGSANDSRTLGSSDAPYYINVPQLTSGDTENSAGNYMDLGVRLQQEPSTYTQLSTFPQGSEYENPETLQPLGLSDNASRSRGYYEDL